MRALAPLLGVLLVACTIVPPGTPPRTSAPIPTGSTTSPPRATPTVTAVATPVAVPSPFSESDLTTRIEPRAMFAHLEALQRIADDAGGTRAVGTAGFDTSVRYVVDVLEEGGYVVDRHRFDLGEATGVSLLVDVPGTGDDVVMIGAHLDSVLAGPGINDNGSGVAALLELARVLAALPPPPRTIRLAFWGAEEGGPIGSAAYVAGLTEAERDEILAYLNVDMIGSPNAFPFVYDEAAAALGSDLITGAFAEFLEVSGVAWDPVDLEGDSDHGPFVAAGIPTGGLFSGGIEPVTDDQAARSATAVAGQPADPCSHRACDTLGNVDRPTLARMVHVISRVLGRIAIDGLER